MLDPQNFSMKPHGENQVICTIIGYLQLYDVMCNFKIHELIELNDLTYYYIAIPIELKLIVDLISLELNC